MALGKLSHEDLNKFVIGHLKKNRYETITGPAVGEDCACLLVGGQNLVLSTDPITAGGAHAGTLAVTVCCNDIAATGATPLAMMVTLLCPPHMTGKDIAAVMQQMQEAAQTLGVDIVGGHTEWTDAVTRLVISTTVIAHATGTSIQSGGMQPGDTLIVTKSAGLEGTAILAHECNRYLLSVCGEPVVREGAGYLSLLSVLPEGLLAAQTPGTHAMHDATEGGILGAAWEMAHASDCGLRLNDSAIPVTPATRAVCQALGIDPLGLISSGAMLIATANPHELLSALSGRGINATVIGRAVTASRGMTLEDGTTLPPPKKDALYQALQQYKNPSLV